MGEYEPHDSRDVTQSDHRAPGEPPRTGPRESSTREGEQAREQQERQAGDERRRAQAEAQDGDHTTVNQARGGPIDEDLMTPEDMQGQSQRQSQNQKR